MIQEHAVSLTFKIRDASSYDSVTNEFDLFTDRLSQPLAAHLVSLAQLTPADRVLDVGAGTGVVSLQAAPLVRPGGKVVGIDLSEAMLSVAKTKAGQTGLTNYVEFSKMDAEALELENQSFDAVLSLFALLHFPDPLAALKEMFRVLRPGGRLVLAVGSGPPAFSFRGLIQAFKHLQEIRLKQQGKLLTAPQFLNSLVEKHFPQPHEVEESSLARHSSNRTGSIPLLVRQAGFVSAQTCWQGHQVVVETPEEFWDMQRTFSSIARKRLSKATPERAEALRAEFVQTCRRVQANGGQLIYPFAAFYVAARRP
ncbi:MAG: class I SAM-dependent methyltransferase [Pyrinomonadaceae bacterium]